MPKEKDENKRRTILSHAKRLFSKPTNEKSGFKELGELTELSASSIHTYFPNKEAVITEIIEHNWQWLVSSVSADKQRETDPKRVNLLLSGLYFPELVADRDLCALILRYPNLVPNAREKLSALGRIFPPLVDPVSLPEPEKEGVDDYRAAIVFLGTIALRYYSEHTDLDLSDKDILSAMRTFINESEPSHPPAAAER
jgi:AcrR family transcriptional regulator